MKKPLILVTSAAGRTASAAVFELLKLGFSVRAMVRRDDQRAKELRNAGAEIVVGDQLNFSDLKRAMEGIKSAYHCPPFSANLLENLMLFALAARESKLENVALMSMWNTTESHPSINSRSHWIANHIYRIMPELNVIHINPGLFAFVYFLSLPVAYNLGKLVLPFGSGMNAPPSSEDIGKLAAHVLKEPDSHIGKCYRPTGPKLISPKDVAQTFSEITGRKVEYQDIPFKMFSKAAKAQGFPTFDISQLKYYVEELKNGAFAVGGVTDHLELVTGKPAESFRTTATRYINSPQLVHPSLELGTRLSTLGFMAKMMATSAPNLENFERRRDHPQSELAKLSFKNQAWYSNAEKQRLNLLSSV